ncbi:hypothetical protein HMPREF9145_1722 [Segatella salivae F0493]|uniref:Uncharacterized protein n=1 Tax=Segatella salivae F0493 TaxID=1395125 RepID=U2MHA5_9BACT|nr:hypothetical protein HMPREF9145_1722 [Segatella salivae F0493]
MLQAIAHGGRHLHLLKSTVQHVGMRFNKRLRLLGGDAVHTPLCTLCSIYCTAFAETCRQPVF